MKQNPLHSQAIGNRTSMLSARATEALQRVTRNLVTSLYGNLPDRMRHLVVSDGNEPRRHLFWRELVFSSSSSLSTLLRHSLSTLLRHSLRHFLGERAKLACDHRAIESFAATAAELPRKVRRLNSSQQQIAIGQCQRTTASVAGGAWLCSRRQGSYAQLPSVKRQYRASPCRDRANVQHRRAQPDAVDLGFEATFEAAVVVRDIAGSTAHVKADQAQLRGAERAPCRCHHPDDAARGT